MDALQVILGALTGGRVRRHASGIKHGFGKGASVQPAMPAVRAVDWWIGGLVDWWSIGVIDQLMDGRAEVDWGEQMFDGGGGLGVSSLLGFESSYSKNDSVEEHLGRSGG